MALPHFSGKPIIELPIDLNLRYILFNNNELDEYVYKIESDKIFFNVNITENGKVNPVDTIMKMINKKQKIPFVDVINNSKDGTVLFKIKLNNFEFVSINNLLDFDYSQSKIMNIEVTYTFDYLEYINISNKNTIRKIKINKLLKRDNDDLTIKLSKNQLGM